MFFVPATTLCSLSQLSEGGGGDLAGYNAIAILFSPGVLGQGDCYRVLCPTCPSEGTGGERGGDLDVIREGRGVCRQAGHSGWSQRKQSVESWLPLEVALRTQELCESRGGRPGLPSLISLRFLWT